MPFARKLLHKLKFGQNILHYVEAHKEKQGTATMGGIVFVLSTVLGFVFFMQRGRGLAVMVLVCFLAFALLGFLDDFLKIKQKRNMGLRAWQKALGQSAIAITIAVFAYLNPYVRGEFILPFFRSGVNFGVFAIFLITFIFIATTNAVNLTDGLDGLATSVSIIFLGGLLVLLQMQIRVSVDDTYIRELQNLSTITTCLLGSLFGFYIFNANKASIFMGDVGSLAIGAFIAAACVFSRLGFYILIFGIMYVISAASVVIQVLYFKKTGGRRVFLMAPYHHHLQLKGMNESKIVAIYMGVTLLSVLLTLGVELL
jgi:phospho-N-acetylmuramoyl-pentapeptide-transferase